MSKRKVTFSEGVDNRPARRRRLGEEDEENVDVVPHSRADDEAAADRDNRDMDIGDDDSDDDSENDDEGPTENGEDEDEDEDGDGRCNVRRKYDIMASEDVEGAEETSGEFGGGYKITPFNLDEEMETGKFDKEGNYYESKGDGVRDAWADSVEFKEMYRPGESGHKPSERLPVTKEREPEPTVPPEEAARRMTAILRPGETVLAAIRRLGGGAHGSKNAKHKGAQQQRKAPKPGDDPVTEETKAKMLELTGYADTVLGAGFYEVYAADADGIRKHFSHRGGGAALSAPGVADNTPAFKTDKAVGALGDVEWEYKWSEDAEELYGPYTSEQMLGWQGEGYFKGDVVVRRVGTADFHKAARVDFDLYT